MSAQYPVLPVAGSTLVRVFASLLSMVAHWLKAARARPPSPPRRRRPRRSRRPHARRYRHQPVRRPRRLLGAVLGRPDRAPARARAGAALEPCADARGGSNAASSARPPTGRRGRRSDIHENGRPLSSAVPIRDTCEHPLSRPDPAPAGPSGGRFNFDGHACCARARRSLTTPMSTPSREMAAMTVPSTARSQFMCVGAMKKSAFFQSAVHCRLGSSRASFSNEARSPQTATV